METVIRKTSRKDQKIATKSVPGFTRAAAILSRKKTDTVNIKIQETGAYVAVPRSALDFLFNILTHMAEGKSISLVPSDSEISTQQAADMLNMSRPHVVKLLEQGEIPYKKTGSHRRIRLEDLVAYNQKLKAQTNDSLKQLAKQAQVLRLGYE
jgi:excisionase family DNA binding protein